MAKKKTKQSKLDRLVARLAKLPHRPDLAIEGGVRTMPGYYRTGGRVVQPQIAIWLDGATGTVRAAGAIGDPDEPECVTREVLEHLLMALIEPVPVPDGGPVPDLQVLARDPSQLRVTVPDSGIPSTIRTTDPALAAVIRDLLGSFGVTVEHVETLPAFDAAFEDFAQYMGLDEQAKPPEPFAWEIVPAAVEPFYKAALAYARQEPWNQFSNIPPFEIALGDAGPREDIDTLYASIMGNGGQVYGIALYYSLDDFEQASTMGEALEASDEQIDAAIDALAQAGVPFQGLSQEEARDLVRPFVLPAGDDEAGTQDPLMHLQESLAVTFDAKEEVDPTYLQWLARHGITRFSRWGVPYPMRTSPGREPYLPDERELRAATLALEAITQAVKGADPVMIAMVYGGERFSYTASVGKGADRRDVTVTVPPPGYTLPIPTTEDGKPAIVLP